MKILLTGGSGVIGRGAIRALLDAGHTVRLLARHADRDGREWRGEGVEAWPGDVGDPETLEGAAVGCDAVIHVAGIVRESSPEVTFQRVNVEGTRNVAAAAARDGAARLIFVSSLGADVGKSDYHRSKREAERIVAEFSGSWTILRPGVVYGPGDEVISSLLVLVRSLPVVPVVGGGDQRFQPIWYEDLGAAIARSLERDDLAGRTLELAGTEITTTNDLLERLEAIEGRDTAELPVPSALAKLGSRVVDGLALGELLRKVLGLDLPMDPAKLRMLEEENFIRSPTGNALVGTLDIEPVPLDEGLRRLAGELPEHLPDHGVGPLQRHRFRIRIHDSRFSPEGLMAVFQEEIDQLLPISFLDPAPDRPVLPGDTLRLRLPESRHVAVRVEEAGPRHVVMATLEGHPLAGVIRFTTRKDNDAVAFGIEITARAAGIYDLFLMRAGGDRVQESTWMEALSRVAERSGGSAPDGVLEERTELEGETATAAEEEIAEMVRSRRASDHARGD